MNRSTSVLGGSLPAATPASAQAGSPLSVQVIWIPLDTSLPTLADLQRHATHEERKRAEQFRSPALAHRFLARRLARRVILAHQSGCAPEQIQFHHDHHGKPYGVTPRGPTGAFNASSSEAWAVIAVAAEGHLGIDVEKHRPIEAELPGLLPHFAPQERTALAALPPPMRLRAFFELWTCKEAFLKARAEGLHRPLDQCALTVNPEAEPKVEWVADEPDAPRQWHLRRLSIAPGYSAMLAADRPIQLHASTWSWRSLTQLTDFTSSPWEPRA